MKNTFYLRLKSVILPIFMLLFMAMSMLGMTQTVTTDKADYLPGEKVIVTGTGWLAGETVNMVIDHQIFDHPDQYLSAVADANGNIFNNNYLIDITDLGELFLLTASGQSSGFTATTTFTDGAPDIEAWHNISVEWSGGTTVQQTNSKYTEGDVLPFQYTQPSGNPAPILLNGQTYIVTLRWDFSADPETNGWFIDYLQSYNATESGVTPFDDFGAGITGWAAIPADPDATLPLYTPGQFYLYNINSASLLFGQAAGDVLGAGEIAEWPYVIESPSGGKTTKRLRIQFTVAGPGAVNAPTSVGIAFGGHLAEEEFYGINKGAGTFPGASPQFRINFNDATSDENININPSAVVPKARIVVVKDANPNDPQDFSFSFQQISPSTGTAQNFLLDDDADVTLSNTQTFIALGDGTYKVTEAPALNWDLSSITVSGATSYAVNNNEVKIAVISGQQATVTYTNLSNPACIPPPCEITGPDNVCSSATLNYAGPISDNLSYSWSIEGDAVINGLTTGQSVEVITNDICSGDFTLILEVSRTDDPACNTICRKTFNINYIGDLTAPDNATATVSCPADAVDPGAPATIKDACGRDVVPVLIGRAPETDPLCEGTVVWTYRYTACDETTTKDWTKTYTIDYTGGLANIPADGGTTVSCPADATDPGNPGDILDACGRTVSAVLVGSSTPPNCEGQVVWTYRYTTCDGATYDWKYTYTIEVENFAIGTPDGSLTVACPADVTVPIPPVVNDNCGNPITPTGPTIGYGSAISATLGNTQMFSGTSTAANRRAMPVTFTEAGEIQSITIYHNGGAGNVLLGVYSDQPGLPSTQLGVTAATVVNPTAGWQTVSLINSVSVTAGQKVWLAWVFQNSVGVRYMAGTPGRAQSAATWAGGMPASFGLSTIANNKFSIYCTYTTEGAITGIPECNGDVIYTWTYTDCEGTAHDWKYTYTISPPVVDMPEDGSETVACKDDANAPEPPVVIDNCGRTLAVEFMGEQKWAFLCEGTVVWLYRYTDCAGKTYDWKYTINVEYEDFKMPPDGGKTISCTDELYTPTPPVVYDNCGKLLTPTGPVISPTPECEGIVTYVWTYTDCEGNSHKWNYTFTIKLEYTNCETAFARGTDNMCFLDGAFDRWGWTNKISPSTSTYSLPLWAGAPVCDPSSSTKGTLVGSIDVTYIGTTITVEYKLTGNYRMSEAHVNVGCNPYPVKDGLLTVAPGQFTFNSGNLDHSKGLTVSFTNVKGDVYIIAHAVTCEESCGCGPVNSKVFEAINLGIDCTNGSTTATLGNTEVYGGTSTAANRRAMPVTFSEAGEIQSLSIYHNGGTGNVLMGIYSDQAGLPSTQLGVTSATVINPTAGWQTVTLTSPVNVTSGQKVWLAWVFQNNIGVRYMAGTPGRAQSSATWAGGMPASFGASTTAGNKFSIFCTYVPGGITLATLGNTDVYTGTSTAANRRAMPVTFSQGGYIQSISIYHNGGTGNVLLGVYSDQPGLPSTQLGVTTSTVVNPTAGWQTVSLISPVTVTTGQKVWLAWVFQNNVGVRYMAGTPGRAQSIATWAGGMPATFGASAIAGNKFSIYCTYIVDLTKSAEIATAIEPAFEKSYFKAYPNPFTDKLNIEFSSATDTQAKLEIYSITGARLATLFNAKINARELYTVDYQPVNIVPGMLIYRLTLDGKVQNGRVVYQK